MVRYSIIIPVHNAGGFLNECIESVLCQTLRCFEIILIDDGSTDESVGICDKYALEHSSVTLIRQSCKGVSAARNAGIDAANGEFLIFLDADDHWCSERMLECIDALAAGSDLVCFNIKTVQNDSGTEKVFDAHSISGDYSSGAAFLEKALGHDPEFSWFCVRYAYRRSLWNEPSVIRFPEGVRFHEDTQVVYRVVLRAGHCAVTEECFYAYRIHSASVSRRDSLQLIKDRIDVNYEQIRAVNERNDISAALKDKLCRNMATAFYVALIHSGSLEKEEKCELMKYLTKVKKSFCKYPATKKQRAVNVFLDVFGVKAAGFVLNIRRRIRGDAR